MQPSAVSGCRNSGRVRLAPALLRPGLPVAVARPPRRPAREADGCGPRHSQRPWMAPLAGPKEPALNSRARSRPPPPRRIAFPARTVKPRPARMHPMPPPSPRGRRQECEDVPRRSFGCPPEMGGKRTPGIAVGRRRAVEGHDQFAARPAPRTGRPATAVAVCQYRVESSVRPEAERGISRSMKGSVTGSLARRQPIGQPHRGIAFSGGQQRQRIADPETRTQRQRS